MAWATGWLLEHCPGAGPGEFRLHLWRAEPGAGTPLLWAHNGSVLWAYFGGQNPCLSDAEALSEPWVRRFLANPAIADRLSGVFALVAVDLTSGHIAVAGDRLGVQGIYYRPSGGAVSHVATHLMWLLLAAEHDGSVDDDACISHFAFGYTLATQTVYHNVHRLPPASTLVAANGVLRVQEYWRPMECAEPPRIAELIDVLRGALVPWPETGLFLPLTAGKDSLCLAALLPEGVAVQTGTFGLADSADRVQGYAVARALQASHTGLDLCEAEALDRWVAHVAFHSAGLTTASYVDMARFVGGVVPPRMLVVLGQGGECVRDFFSGPDGSLAALSRDYMTAGPLLHASLHPRLAKRLVDYPAALLDRAREMASEPDEAGFALHFYRAMRMPGNFSLRHAVLAPLRPTLSPFLDRDFVNAAYGLPHRWFAGSRLHRMILETAKPGWLGFFDRPQRTAATTQGWDHRMAGDTGRRLAQLLAGDLPWCDDVFEPDGVRELMSHAAAHAGKTGYHLLRVASFAAGRRLLRREAAAHAAWIAGSSDVVAAGGVDLVSH